MKTKIILLNALAVCLLFSCKPMDDDFVGLPSNPCHPYPCPDPNRLGKLDTVWTYRLHEDYISGFSYGMALIDNVVIHNTTYNSGYGLGIMIGLDPDFGSLNWDWRLFDKSHYSSFNYHEEKKLAVVQNYRYMAVIDVTTGNTHRSYVEQNYSAATTFGQLLGDYYYFTRSDYNSNFAQIVRSHLDDFSTWEVIYTITRDEVGGSRPNIQSYNLWIDPQSGDEILVFQHRMAFPVRVDLVGFNMTKGSVIWKHDDLAILKNSNAERIFMLDGRAYFPGSSDFYCVNILSGEIEWTFYHPSGIHVFLLLETLYAEEENLIIVKDAGPNLFAFDPLSGEVVWQRTDYASSLSSGSPKYHNGIIYWIGSHDFGMCLNAVRAINGEKLWAERSRLKGHSQFNGDIAIDPERGVLYASDRYYLMAIKLYED